MKLISLTVLPLSIKSSTFTNYEGQARSRAAATDLVSKLNMITERRIFPELISISEAGQNLEDQDNYEGHYAMEQPNVNFLLDFSNEELVNFRIHAQKYQQKASYLDQMGWGGGSYKKSGGQEDEVDEQRDEDKIYNDYKNRNPERFTRPTRANLLRRIASQEMMIQYVSTTKRRFGAYFNYGCHCFPGSFYLPKNSPHAMPIDDIDKACREHSWAYDCARQDFGDDCRGKYQLYNWVGRISKDGFTKELICTDSEDTCAWAICQADKYLAERLSDLEFEYSEEKLVNPQDGALSGFDRHRMCEIQQVNEVDREHHNNDEQLVVRDEPQASVGSNNGLTDPNNNGSEDGQITPQSNNGQGRQIPGGLLPNFDGPENTADLDFPNLSNYPDFPNGYVPNLAGTDENGNPTSINRNSGFALVPNDNDATSDEVTDPNTFIPDQADWQKMTIEERKKWYDLGWQQGQNFVTATNVKDKQNSNGKPGTIIFGNVYKYPQYPNELNFADIQAANPDNFFEEPDFTHSTTEAPETEFELTSALEKVADNVDYLQNLGLYADHIVPEFDFEDENEAARGNSAPQKTIEQHLAEMGEPIDSSTVSPENLPAAPEITNNNPQTQNDPNLPKITLKSSITHSYRQCCGQYPTRYKYSTKKMGCCKDHGIERLYNPANAKCCIVKDQRKASNFDSQLLPGISYLTNVLEKCDEEVVNANLVS